MVLVKDIIVQEIYLKEKDHVRHDPWTEAGVAAVQRTQLLEREDELRRSWS
jgi:hypothetical protein